LPSKEIDAVMHPENQALYFPAPKGGGNITLKQLD